MSRVAIVGLFIASEELVKKGNIKAIDRIVNAVLKEARVKNKEE